MITSDLESAESWEQRSVHCSMRTWSFGRRKKGGEEWGLEFLWCREESNVSRENPGYRAPIPYPLLGPTSKHQRDKPVPLPLLVRQ